MKPREKWQGRKAIGTPDDPTVVFTMRVPKSVREKLRIPPPKRLLVAVRELAQRLAEEYMYTTY